MMYNAPSGAFFCGQTSMESKNSDGTNQKITKRAGVVAFYTMLSRIAGLARDLVVVNLFGASGITDAFFIAFTIPNMMRRFVAEGALTVAFVPVYTDVLVQDGRKAAREFFKATLGALLLLLFFLVAAGMYFSEPLVLAFASGFSDEPDKLALATNLTRSLFPYVFFISLVALCMGALNANKRFAAPAAAPIFLNLSMIGCTWGLYSYFEQPIFGLAVGVLLGGVIQLLLQIPSMREIGLLTTPSSNWDSAPLKRLVRILIPALFGVAVYQLNLIVLRQLASYLPAGQITHYYNADRLMQLALGVFAISIATAALPSMSEQRVRKDLKALSETWFYTTRLTNFITIPAALGLIGIAGPIASVLYFHGAYTQADVNYTAMAAVGFAPGLVAIALTRTTVQAFYAFEDMKTPVYVGIGTVIVNLGLGISLLHLEVFGLALTLSVSSIFQAIVLIVLLKNRLKLSVGTLAKSMGIQLVLGLISVAAAWWTLNGGSWELGPTPQNCALLMLGVSVAVVFYFSSAWALGLDELRTVKNKIK